MKKGNLTLWILLVAVLAIGIFAGIYFPYHSQQDKVNKLTTQVSSLQTQLKAAQKPGSQNSGQTSVPAPQTSYGVTSSKGVKAIVYTPAANAKVASPVAVVGQVPGSWSFEAQFPVVLKDSSGNTVAQGTAQLLGDWMTDNLVPFSVQLTYSASPSGSGSLVLQKDNPSGKASNDDTITIPVHF